VLVLVELRALRPLLIPLNSHYSTVIEITTASITIPIAIIISILEDKKPLILPNKLLAKLLCMIISFFYDNIVIFSLFQSTLIKYY